MRMKSLSKSAHMAVWALALGSIASLAGCVDRLSVTAVAEPSLIVMGEGAVSLNGEVVSKAEFAELEWRLAKRPEGSTLTFPAVFDAKASFTPDVPGDYEFQFTATGGSTRSGGGLASGVGGRTMASTRVKVSVLRRPVGVLGFVTQPSNIAAGSAFEPSVSVELRTDDGEIVVEPIGVTLSVRGGTQFAQILGTQSVTTVEGVATFTDLSVDLVGTGYTLEATADGMTSAESEAFAVVAGAPDLEKSTLVASPKLVKSDGQATSNITLTLKDAYDNAVVNTDVVVAVTGTGHMFAGGNVQTDPQGQYSTTLSSTNAETKTVTATFGAPAKELSVDITFAKEIPSASNSQIFVPDSVTADGVTEEQVSVVLRAENGNYAPGVPVTFSSLEPADVFAEQIVTTGEDGMATVTLTSTKSGRRELTASFGDETLTATILFRAGAPVQEKSSFTANPTSLPADYETQSTLTVVLIDKHGNPVSDTWVTISADIEAGGYSFDGEMMTDENGVATGFLTAGVLDPVTLTASVWGPEALMIEMSVTVTFTPGAPRVYGIYGNDTTSACMWVSFESGQSQDFDYEVRFHFHGKDGVLKPATSTRADGGNESVDRSFEWNADADLVGFSEDVVTLVATPFMEYEGEIIEGPAVSKELRVSKLFYSPVTMAEPGVVSVDTASVGEGLTHLWAGVAAPPSLVAYEGSQMADRGESSSDNYGSLQKLGEVMSLSAAPIAFVSGDLNNDGWLDAVVAYPELAGKPGGVEVRIVPYGDEDPTVSENLEITPAAMVLWDVNGMGELDLVVVGTQKKGEMVSNVVAVLENSQMGFSESYTIIASDLESRLTGLAVRESWSTESLEIVVTDEKGNVHVFRSPTTAMRFTSQTLVSGFADAHSPVLIESPQYGLFDIVVASKSGKGVSILKARMGDGSAEYDSAKFLAKDLSAAPLALAAGDFMNYEDVVVVLSSGDVHLLANNYGEYELLESVSKVGAGASSITVGDFNRDWNTDFATANKDDGTISVIYGGFSRSECGAT